MAGPTSLRFPPPPGGPRPHNRAAASPPHSPATAPAAASPARVSAAVDEEGIAHDA
eukprot:CAMPEP_0179066476 /NCGR_PEP_ID=MMETSP0796-20121207/28993_1 /TAXON_ID=73915 /ORGANISM="Pyrodinium bahamense, Strain pbaha01" /LENGTH=55 /DNA_ID=CAMNT_0020763475 /DNA_START=41 /DNA_END=205 /DNA_ORIENTATION=+